MRPRGILTIAIVSSLLLIGLAGQAAAWSPAAVSIAAANDTSVALLDDGTAWQWGYNVSATPLQVEISGVRQIAAGYGHVLALKGDGTVWAWGSNTQGQLGDGTYQGRALPVRILSGVKAIAAGRDHSLALKEDGTVWAWGSNSYGQIGEGSLNYTGSTLPTRVNGLNGILAISSGGAHSLALQNDGTVWAWGENAHGVLGDGTNESRFSPVRSKLTDVKAMDAGESGHGLAVRSDGNVWSWGYDYMGQLGKGGVSMHSLDRLPLGPEADSYNPDIVRGLSSVKAVAAGGSHSVALATDGTVWTWGSNSDGQLGQGSAGGKDLTSPGQVKGLDGITAIAAGRYHTLALKSDGSVWAWGSNSEGQIGNDSIQYAAAPLPVLMSSQVPPTPSPTPVIVVTPPPEATPGPPGTNYMLIGAIGLLVVIAAVIVAACWLFLGKKGKAG
jgi:alpha-tubulin suppressor-like RCC1 family protein